MNDRLFPKIMKVLLSKYWLKIWALWRSQYCKRFWFSSCIRIYYFELYVWNKRIFNMYLIVFSNNRLFPKIMKILLFKYWLKSWALWRSQFCKRFWLAYCIGKIFILNSTLDIILFLTWIWCFFFSNDPVLPKIMKILLLKYWVRIWVPSLSEYCKRFWLANFIRKIFILNHTPEITLFLAWIWHVFLTMHFSQKSCKCLYSNIG